MHAPFLFFFRFAFDVNVSPAEGVQGATTLKTKSARWLGEKNLKKKKKKNKGEVEENKLVAFTAAARVSKSVVIHRLGKIARRKLIACYDH